MSFIVKQSSITPLLCQVASVQISGNILADRFHWRMVVTQSSHGNLASRGETDLESVEAEAAFRPFLESVTLSDGQGCAVVMSYHVATLSEVHYFVKLRLARLVVPTGRRQLD